MGFLRDFQGREQQGLKYKSRRGFSIEDIGHAS